MKRPEGESGKITIAARVRPLALREIESSNHYCAVECPEPGRIKCTRVGSTPVFFSVDNTFCSISGNGSISGMESQQEVYQTLALPLLNKAIVGFNACLFAYGVTSSGKTYSMYGTPENPGIVPRIVEDLFVFVDAKKPSNSLTVRLSFFEIYNEKIFDLLQDKKTTKQITIREHPVTGPFVEGLTEPTVNTRDEVAAWLRQGESRRSVATTEMNANSSRSHTILTFIITRKELIKFPKTEAIENVYTSKLNLVDLAGSERHSFANNSSERLLESCQINKSLFTLGKVISQLSSHSTATNVCWSAIRPARKRLQPTLRNPPSDFRTPQVLKKPKNLAHVSYRDSLLTWILKESLGGNSVTVMLATLSPSSLHIDDTLSTLQYAKRAQNIVNNAIINEGPEGRVIRELMSEITCLRRRLDEARGPHGPLFEQIKTLQSLLSAREEVENLTGDLTKHPTDSGLSRFPVSQCSPSISSPLGTSLQFTHPHNLIFDDCWDTPVMPSKRCKISPSSVDAKSAGSFPALVSLSRESETHLINRDKLNCESVQISHKVRVDCSVQTDPADAGGNPLASNGSQTDSVAHTAYELKPESRIMKPTTMETCCNTNEDDLAVKIVSQSDFHKREVELCDARRALDIYQSVKKEEASTQVNETAFDLCVMKSDEVNLINEIIRRKQRLTECAAQTEPLEEMELITKRDLHNLLNKIAHQKSRLEAFDNIVKHDVSTSDDESNNCTLMRKSTEDRATRVDEDELGVTCMSVNLFHHIYDQIHCLRVKLRELEHKPKSDAHVSTDPNVKVLLGSEFDNLLSQVRSHEAEEIKETKTDINVAVLEPMSEQVDKRSIELESKRKKRMVIGKANASTNTPTEVNNHMPKVCIDVENEYVRSRVRFFENLQRGASIYAKLESKMSNSNARSLAKDEQTIVEELNQEITFLQSKLEGQRWDVEYLDKMNKKLSTERNFLAKMLSTLLRQDSDPSKAALRTTECLDNLGPLSEEFRQEMEAILKQYDQ